MTKSEYHEVLQAAVECSEALESADRPTSAQDVTAYEPRCREPRSARTRGTALLFGLIMTGLAGTYFTYFKAGPRSAGAAVTEKPDSTESAITTFLTAGPATIKQMDRLARQTEKLAQQLNADPAAAQVPVDDLRTNPFRQSPSAGEFESPRHSALRAAQAMYLQSILVTSKNRSCMIDNAMYLEGQAIGQFTVEQIKTETVILRTGVYRFELKQQ